MNLNETTIAKINSLQEDLLYEVHNFIDFIYSQLLALARKIKSYEDWIKNNNFARNEN